MFKKWLETDNENNWRRLYDHLLLSYKKNLFANPNYHITIIQFLEDVGLNNLANEFKMILPSSTDMDYSQKPFSTSGGLTLGAVTDLNRKRENEASFKVAYKAFNDLLEAAFNAVEKKFKEMGWEMN